MAKINNSEVSDEIRKVGKIQLGSDIIPNILANQVIAVAEVNPKIVKNGIHKAADQATTGANTIYTTPTNQDFYLTSVVFSFDKDAVCNVATGSISVNFYMGGAAIYLGIPVITLTAERGTVKWDFSHALKIDRGTNISMTNNAYGAGVMTRQANITGFLDETSNA